MEKKLQALFDYQRFEQNKKLAEMISETEKSMETLSDDELSLVNAAGEADTGNQQYGLDNNTGMLKPGSRFYEKWLNENKEK